MQNRNQVNKSSDFAHLRKLNSHGYYPRNSSEFREVEDVFIRPSTTLFDMGKISPRKENYQSIYTHKKDLSLTTHLYQRNDQIESLDQGKAAEILLKSTRTQIAKKVMKFSYDRPISQVISDFETNRT
jgi:hypothetical protein